MISVYSSLKKAVRALIISMPVFYSNHTFAQNDENFPEYRSALVLQHADAAKIRYKKLQYAVHHDVLIYVQYLNNKSDDTLRFYKKDIVSGKEEKVNVFIKDFHKIYDPRSIYTAIDFNDQHVVLLLSNDLIIIKHHKHSGYSYHSLTRFDKTGYSFEGLSLKNDKIILYANYNFSNPRLSKDYKTCIAVFDIAQQKILKSIKPVFDRIELTHLAPNTYIHVSTDDHIIFSQGTAIHYTLYDLLLEKTDSASFIPNKWKMLNEIFFDSVLMATKFNIPQWAQYIYENSSRVSYSFLLNKNKVLTGYFLTRDSLVYGLFTKNNGHWEMIASKGFSIKEQELKKEITDKNDWFLYHLSWSQNVCFDHNNVYILKMMTDKLPWDMSVSAMKEYEEKYYENNDPVVYVFKAQIK